jgi:serine/threonine protein kinase
VSALSLLDREDDVSSISASVGTYQLIAEIARGGMGRVCLCRRAGEAGFARLFALKLMHRHLACEEEFVEMLLDEAHLAAQINHPNVVGIVDLGRYEGGYYLVMDYVEGASLHELLSRETEPRPPSLILKIAVDVLRGLHAAHTQTDESGQPLGIVHRDVSPHNVLVGVDGTARLTDFGIAKAVARISSTKPGIRKGKFEYMSPEQIESGQCDARSDVFSFGVLLWNCFTGKRLFRGDSDAETLHNVLDREIPPPSTVGLAPPAWLDAPILRALDRDPDKRYESAEAMAEHLLALMRDHGALGDRSEVSRWVKARFGDQLTARRAQVAATRTSRRPIAMVLGGELALAEASPLPHLSPLTPRPTGLRQSLSAPTVAAPGRARVIQRRARWRRAALAAAITVGLLLSAFVALAVAWDDEEQIEVRPPPAPPVELAIPPPPPPVEYVAPAPEPVDVVAAETSEPPRRRARAQRRRVNPLERMDSNPYLR